MILYREYKCTACGNRKPIQTNHDGSCLDFCPSCSWKAFWKGESASYPIPQHRHGRLFVRVLPLEPPGKETARFMANRSDKHRWSA